MDGFTLTEFAFPVAPANLVGFTAQGFAWVGGPEPEQPITIPRVCVPGIDRSRVSVIGTDRSRVSVPAIIQEC